MTEHRIGIICTNTQTTRCSLLLGHVYTTITILPLPRDPLIFAPQTWLKMLIAQFLTGVSNFSTGLLEVSAFSIISHSMASE